MWPPMQKSTRLDPMEKNAGVRHSMAQMALTLTHRPFGLHFTNGGYVATVTIPGNVFLLDRETGAIVASMDVASEYEFVAPEPALPANIDLLSFFPKSSEDDFVAAFGTKEAANITLGNFLGVSGNFTDNTLAVSVRDEIYIQGEGRRLRMAPSFNSRS